MGKRNGESTFRMVVENDVSVSPTWDSIPMTTLSLTKRFLELGPLK